MLSTADEGVTAQDKTLKIDRLLSKNRSATVLQVDESALKILLKSKNVKRFKLVGDKHGYDLFLETTGGLPGMLVTLRQPGKPRRRSSVDGFIRWLERQGVELPPIYITFG